MKKRLIAFMFAMTLILSLLAACGGGNTASDPPAASSQASSEAAASGELKPVTLRFGNNFGEISIFRAALEEVVLPKVEELYPQITLEIETSPGEQLKTVVAVQVASGTLPDVLQFWASPAIAQGMVEGNSIITIDEYFAASETLSRSDFDPEILAGCASPDGNNYVIPTQGSQGFILYNKEIFDRFSLTPPETYEELLEVSKVFNENGIVPFATASNVSIPGHFFMSRIAWQYENGISDSDNIKTTYQYDTPAFREAAKYIELLRQEKVFPADTVANGQWAGVNALFLNGSAAMVEILTFNFPDYANHEIASKAEPMYFPKFPGATVDPKTVTFGQAQDGLIVSKNGWDDPDKQAAIVKFYDLLTADEVYQHFAPMTWAMKTSADYSMIEFPEFVTKLNDFNKGMEYHYFTKGLIPTASLVTAYEAEVDRLFAGDVSPDDFIANVQANFDKEKP